MTEDGLSNGEIALFEIVRFLGGLSWRGLVSIALALEEFRHRVLVDSRSLFESRD
jgi:hypothetical protein